MDIVLRLPTQSALCCTAFKGKSIANASPLQMMQCVVKLLSKDKFVRNLKTVPKWDTWVDTKTTEFSLHFSESTCTNSACFGI